MSVESRMNPESAVEDLQGRPVVRDEAAALFLRGIERIAEVQKQYIDISVQHNSEMVDMLKKAAEKVPGMPRISLLDVTTGAVGRYADVQKASIDFVVEQARVWTNMFKDRTSTVKKSADSTTNVAKQTMEQSFAVQKMALEHTAAQTKAVVDATRRQFGLTGAQADALTDTFQKGVDTVMDAQKEFLEMVTH